MRAGATGSLPKILIVDDEPGIRFGVRDFLEAEGLEVEEADSCAAAERAVRESHPDAVVLDHMLPDGTALELLPRIREIDATVPVVVLTGHATIDLAVRAIKEGADQFLAKPVELKALLVMLRRLLESQREKRRQAAGRARQAREAVDPFTGTSAVIRRLAEDARKVAASSSPILIEGDTGSGKGVLARWLHRNGPRADEAFVDMNCAGLSREFLETELFGHERGAYTGAVTSKQGLLEVAHRGVVFLDEIGDLDPQVQPKLLKVLEEKRFRRLGDVRDRQVDVQLVAASHQNLPQLVQEKKFRSDLYYRISTIPLRVPALRERAEDIPVLARQLLGALASDLGRRGLRLSEAAERALTAYAWPGNVRELRNVLERAALLCGRDALEASDLRFESAGLLQPKGESPAAAESEGSHLTLEGLERIHIERVLRELGGRVTEASQRLGIPRSTLYQKLKRYGIARPSPFLKRCLESGGLVPDPERGPQRRSAAGPSGPQPLVVHGRLALPVTARRLARLVLAHCLVSDHRGRLLIVDDESAIRFALVEYFRGSGWTVDSAAEKEEAEALLACTAYSVVIADLRLTGTHGVEGLDIVQWSRHLRPETRVVLLTGNATPEIEAEARRRGADAFLQKPLPLPQLEAIVDSLVARAA